ncbi:FxSxx-COOH system tetratricopeptide repeat protein [Streptomyces sp. NPDC002133]|uniref:FxSxx-COOH system tetratricopeptide repeat protein n=1 Tax=Streptomyces sp. NPDC002133 TaxID=3154409 RepID=UPI003318A424
MSGTGAAHATEGGLANAGYIHQVSAEQLTMVQQHGPREPATWPHQVGVIPSRAQFFQHRAEVERLRSAIEGGGTAVLGQVLTGMGGVGKTQLAADYARTAWDDDTVDVLVWITASARSPVVTGYAQAGVELSRADPNDPQQAAQAFLAWLTPKAGAVSCRWLIVLDDVADPDDLVGLWPPPSPYGRTLVTTRRRDAALTGDGRHLVELGLFSEAEAVAYLTESLANHGRHEPADQLTALASDLGYLPLALAQAAAYLIDSGEGTAAYRELLADRATTLADAAPDRLPDEQDSPLAAAWSLSIERADALRPFGLARPMLHLAALLDANGIPQAVLASEPALTHLAPHRTRTGQDRSAEPSPVSTREAKLALRALHRLSLVDYAPDQAVRVHQLIQRAARDTLTPDQHHHYARTAADALLAAWPEIERDTALAQALRANTTALTTCAEDALYRPDAHAVLYQAGRSLGESGQAATAVRYFQHLSDTTTHRFGPDHPDTLTARYLLAYWRGEAGDVSGAAAATEQVLHDMTRLLGDEHPDLLTIRGNLAHWWGEAGDPAGAAEVLADLLDDELRVLGPDDLETLSTRRYLARWRGEAGDAQGAAAALAELLADELRVLGPDHPETLETRNLLAWWRGMAGDAEGAAAEFAELVADRVRVLGPDDPATLTARQHLATWQKNAGNPAGAAVALADLLEDQLRVLGPDHPYTLNARGELAKSRGMAGDPAGAAAALAELVADRVRVLGPDHPDAFTTLGNLAHWRAEAGDAAGAARAYEEFIPDLVRTLGEAHPATLTARHNLAHWRGEAGDAAGAATALTELLPELERELGADHSLTLAARHNIAFWREALTNG